MVVVDVVVVVVGDGSGSGSNIPYLLIRKTMLVDVVNT